MAFDSWPSTLPSNFLIAGYSFAMGDGRLRTKMDVGPEKVRLRSSFAPSPLSGTVLLDGSQIQILQGFVRATLLGGTLPFLISDPVLSTISGHRALVRFVELPNWTAITPDLYSVTLRLEQLDTISPPAPVFSTAAMLDAREDIAYSWTPTVIEGTRPLRGFSIVSGSLPQGLSFDPSTGRIAGVVPFFGTFSFTLRVEDAEGRTATLARTLTVRPPAFIFAGEGADRIILDPVTVRNSIATYWGKDGLLHTAPANTPRFEYDPFTGVFKGVLIEEARTNHIFRSANVSNITVAEGGGGYSSSPGGGVISSELNVGRAPDGSFDATRVTWNPGAGATSRIFQSTNVPTVGEVRTNSVWMRGEVGGERVRVCGYDGNNGYVYGPSIVLDIVWRRYSFTYTCTQASVTYWAVLADVGATFPQSVRMWGAQAETGAFPTSYIPTTTAAATRAADQLSLSNVADWWNPAEGTLILQASTFMPTANGVADRTIFSFDNGAANQIEQVDFRVISYDDRIDVSTRARSTGSNSLNSQNTVDHSEPFELAFAMKSGGWATALNGEIVNTSVGATAMPTNLSRFRAGQRGTGAVNFNGHIRSLDYIPRARIAL